MNCAKQSSARAIQRRRSNSWAVVIICGPPVGLRPALCDNRKLSSGFGSSTIRNLGSVCVLVVTQATTRARDRHGHRHQDPSRAAAQAEPTQRADARRNRERVLDAAREQFAERRPRRADRARSPARPASASAPSTATSRPRRICSRRWPTSASPGFAEWAREALEDPDAWDGLLRASCAARREVRAEDRAALGGDGPSGQACAGRRREKDELHGGSRRRWSSEPRRRASCAPTSAPRTSPC